MARRTAERLRDMLDAIQQLEILIDHYPKTKLEYDRMALAAFERFVEILSEASRHVPVELKDTESHIPWRDIANIGNYLRHAYPTVDFGLLWSLHEAGQIQLLKKAVERLMILANKPS